MGQRRGHNFSLKISVIPAGDTLHSHGWTAHSGAGTNPPLITSGGLTYTGYVGSGIGNAVSFTTTGEDDNRLFATYPNGVTSGSLYYSVMVRLDSVATAGDYFFHVLKNSSTFSARIFAKRAANGNIRFGIARTSTAANVSYSDSIYTVGTTYLLVAKYTVIPGATNDTVALWINPTIGGAEPAPTVLESAIDRTGADIDTVYGVAVRQGTAANAPIGVVDGIRMDTAWPLGPAGGPLTGTKTIPGTYPSLAAAITDLNTLGVGAGGVTFNVAGGYTETITAPLSITATGTVANPIVFQKSGAGANPLVTAYATGSGTPSTAVQDGIWQLVGSDYVTIDGIDLLDPNTTNPATMEYGYALYKASATDGCQNVTIRNCTITLNRVNNDLGSGPAVDGSRGIDVVNAIPTAATTALTVTAASGSNSNNKFYHNTIQNCNIGIALIGFADVTPFANADQGNDIGGSSAATGNTIRNYGGGGITSPAAAVRTLAQYGINVSYNTINNNDGAGVNHATTLRGIYLNTATSASATVTNNTLTIQSAVTTAQVSVIENASGSTAASNTITISNNSIQNCTNDLATTGAWYGLWNSASAATLDMSNNGFLNNSSMATSGTTYLIYNSGAVASTITLNNNNPRYSFTGTAAYTGTMYSIYNASGTTLTTVNINTNIFSNYLFTTATGTGTIYFIYNGASPLNLSINGNSWGDLVLNHSGTEYLIYNGGSTQAGTLTVSGNGILGTFTRTAAAGSMYCYYAGASSLPTNTQIFSNNNFMNISAPTPGTGSFYGFYNSDGASSPYPKKSVFNNNIVNVAYNATGTFYGFYTSYLGDGSTTSGSSIYNNTVSNVTFGGTMYCFYPGGIASPTYAPAIYGNNINTNGTTGAATSIYGYYITGGGAGLNFYKNKVYGITANGATGAAYGAYVASGTTLNIYNNLIGNIAAPNSSPAAAPYLAVTGLYIGGGTTTNASYNTVDLNTTSVGTNFTSAALYVTTSPTTVTLRDNIFNNLSTPTGAGFTLAFGRNGTALTNYAAASNNNDFYAGTPGASHLIFYDGTNSDQTLAAFKTRVTPREAVSITENPAFVSTSGGDATFLHINPVTPTQLESGGTPITGITDDYDGDTRNALTPDIGADEFAGVPIDLNPPAITYTPLSNGGVVATRTLATNIGDVSGVQRNTAGAPRIYYKKGAAGTYVEAQATTIVGSGFTFTIDHATVGGIALGDTIFYYVGAQDSLGNAGTNPGGGSGINPPGNVPPASPAFYRIVLVVSSFPYTQDFESGAGGWESGIFSGTVNDWVRGTPAKTIINGAHSGTNAWVTALTGQYQANENAFVQSPTFDFSALTGDPLLSFWHIFSTELSYDAAIIEYSTDGGATFNRLGILNDPAAQNWYNNNVALGPIAPPKWSGSSSTFGTGYVNSRRPLTGLAGHSSVVLRFRFGSDVSGQDEGWAFDDVSITTPPLKDIQVVSASVTPPAPQVGTPVTVSAVIKNNGIESDPASVSLTYKPNSAPADSIDGTVQVFAPTWSSHEATVTFTTTYTPIAAGSVTMWVRSFYPGDGDTTNNTASSTINVLPAGTYLSEGFTEVDIPTRWMDHHQRLEQTGSNASPTGLRDSRPE